MVEHLPFNRTRFTWPNKCDRCEAQSGTRHRLTLAILNCTHEGADGLRFGDGRVADRVGGWQGVDEIVRRVCGHPVRGYRLTEDLAKHLVIAAGDFVRNPTFDGMQHIEQGRSVQIAGGFRANARKQVGLKSDQLGVRRDLRPHATLLGMPFTRDDFEVVLDSNGASGIFCTPSFRRVYPVGEELSGEAALLASAVYPQTAITLISRTHQERTRDNTRTFGCGNFAGISCPRLPSVGHSCNGRPGEG